MERKVFKMYELGGSDACTARRSFDFVFKDRESEIYKKAVATKSVISDCLKYGVNAQAVDEIVKDRFNNLDYISKEQKDVQINDTARQVKRYLLSETRRANEAAPKEIVLNDEMAVIVSPDYWFRNNDEIEVVKIKCSKPSMIQREAYNDIGLYSMLKYAENLAAELDDSGIHYIKASYYFLGKKNDSYSADEPNFDTDFFDTVGGLNIVSMSSALDHVHYVDGDFNLVLKAFVEGIPSQECTENDCKNCQLRDICKYEEPPIRLDSEEVSKTISLGLLTPSQKEAVNYKKGIVRINAGAGAGKTAVVAIRVATLLSNGVKPEEICLVTFTNAGAGEMRSRIAKTLEAFGEDEEEVKEIVKKITIQTFNAFGDDIVKKEYAKLGFSAPPSVIDDIERSHIIAKMINDEVKKPKYDKNGKEIRNPLKSLNWRNFTTNSKHCRGALATTKHVFDVMKKNEFSVADIKELECAIELSYWNFMKSTECLTELAKLYDRYDNTLREDNLIEFADQENLVFEILHDDPFYFEQFGFKHIIVDEFQDSSARQVEMIKLMTECPTFESLMVVGDDSQSIFGFRDTSCEYIINFNKYIGREVDDIYLLENHRSTPEIIEFANKINANNYNRVEKDLISTRPSGKPVTVRGFMTPDEEESFVVDEIKKHLADGFAYEDIAVICYTKYELLKMAGLLRKENIPSVMLNPEPLVENGRVKAAIAIANAIKDPEDTKDALIYANALNGGGLLSLDEKSLEKHLELVNAIIKEYHETEGDEAKKEKLMEILRRIDLNDDEIYQSFLETLERKNIYKIFEYLNEFYLYGSSAAVKRNCSYPGVVLTTAHSSKGLEWKVVFNMISKYDSKELKRHWSDIDERRRLLFVSSTRARDELYVTSQYTAYGKRGDYTYNRFLIESLQAIGETFSATNVETERTIRAELAKAKRAEEKKQKEAEKIKAKKKEVTK